jgi:hypothetical protein
MKVILTQGDFGTYELTPANKRLARKLEKDTGNESVLFQTDWDFPPLARTLGWNMKVKRGDKCEHSSTDGTVTCRECGATAHDFIQSAIEFLDNHDGHVFRGKGEEYFNL